MKIKEIKITGFKSIKDELHIKDFGNILSLVGKNNAGKSSILNALRLFWECIKINPTDFTHGGTSEIEIGVLFEIQNKSDLFNYSLLSTATQKTAIINELKTNFPALNTITDDVLLKKIKNEDLTPDELTCLYDKYINVLKIEVDDNTILIKYKAQLTSGNIECKYIKKDGTEDKNYFSKKEGRPSLLFIGDDRKFDEEENSSNGSITAKLIKDLNIKKEEITIPTSSTAINVEDLETLIENKFAEKTKNIGDNISDYFKKFYDSSFNEIKLAPTYSGIDNSNFKIKAKIKDPITREFIDLNNLGAGLRSIYILSLLKAYNDINKGNNTIFIIEEPELYLHPELQKEMSGTLNELSEEHTVLFTTHSPLLLNKLKIDNIRNTYFDIPLKTTKIKDANMDIICNDLGYSSLDILNKEKILFVEGTSDIHVYDKIIKKFYNGVSEKVKIIAIGGCSNLPQYATLNFIGESPILLKQSLIVLDRDYQPSTSNVNTDTNRKNSFKIGLKKIIDNDIVDNYDDTVIHITEGHSLENFFLDFPIINTIYPGIGLDETMLRSEFRGFANGHGYFDSNKFKSHYNKINKIPDYFDNIENSSISIENIRGHNLMHYIVYKCYGANYSNITSENELEFCTKYIQNSNSRHFQPLLDFLNGTDLFNDNKK